MYLIKKENRRPIPCDAVTHSSFIDPDGKVFSCIYLTDELGKITERILSDILKEKKIPGIKKKVKNCQTPCWQKCTARISVVRNLHKVLPWILLNKIKVHLNIPAIG